MKGNIGMPNVRSVVYSFSLLTLVAAHGQSFAAPLDIADKPLFLKTGVAPNVIVTLDDSGSMAREYVPNDRYGRTDLRYYAAKFNGMAYNPNVTYAPPLDSNGNELSTSFTSAWENGITQSGGTRNLSNDYLDFDIAPDGDTADEDEAFYAVWDDTNANCDSSNVWDNDCYDKILVTEDSGPGDTDERQNFANWFSFYRNRNIATISGASRAFAELGSQIRLGWQSLNDQAYVTGVRQFSGSHRDDFYDWLFALPDSGGTPLRRAMERAGDYYGTDEPYLEDPTDSDSEVADCRQNYHVLMSDGGWNGWAPSDDPRNADNTDQTLPDGTTFDAPRAPYSDDYPVDSNGETHLADLAFKYWATDLRDTMDDIVSPFMPVRSGTPDENYWNPRNDPATWQHMINFTVGLGLSNLLTDPEWGGSTYEGDYDQLVAGNVSWPAGGSEDSNVYDMWHAAINSRGQFFSAEDPQSLTNAFSSIISRIADRSATASSVSLDSGSLTLADSVFISRFNSRSWTGRLIAFDLTASSGIGAAQWDAACALDGGSCETDGDTYTGISDENRRIVTLNSSTNAGVPFRWSDISAAQQGQLEPGGDGQGSARLSYLRGDQSSEEDEGGSFRNRDSLLGDIIHSAPRYVAAPIRFYPVDWDDATTSNNDDTPEDGAADTYADFKSDNSDRDGVVYVAANDGMLHAFDAANGSELFAYVPSAVYDNLHLLTDPSYDHKFYVDSTPTEGDAFFDGDSAWHTVLLGGLGTGGQGIYALDITDVPDSGDSETAIDDKVLWEFDDTDSGSGDGDEDLGQTFSRPQLARTHDGEWVAIFGNGYNNTAPDTSASSTGNAVLYIVDVEDGTLIRKIDTGVGSADDPSGNSRPNGLATPTLADIDGDFIVDYAYAGDLYGNLWKFDLRSSNTSNWSVMYSNGGTPTPLFTAADSDGDRLPITTRPSIRRHPTGNGFLLMFGTGKYFEDGDEQADPSVVQSIFGIWDLDQFTNPTSGNPQPTLTTFDRNDLLEQSITLEQTVNGNDYRVISDDMINWADDDDGDGSYELEDDADGDGSLDGTDTEHMGWMLPLSSPDGPEGEMQITDTLARGNRLIFTTLVPNDDPCSLGGDSWLMSIDIFNGGRFDQSSFETNSDGVFDESDWIDTDGDGEPDTPNSGIGKNGVRAAPTLGAGQDGVDRLYLGPEENSPDCEGTDCEDVYDDPSLRSRQSWRQAR